MNAQVLQGQWNQLRGQVKQQWGQLTDSDLDFQNGNVDELVGRIQQRTGEARDAIEQFLGSLTENSSSGIAQATESVRQFAQQAGGRLGEGYGRLSDAAAHRLEMAGGMVQRRPGQSVAAAFGLGLVVGVIVGVAFQSRS